jgi:hypothetical protein
MQDTASHPFLFIRPMHISSAYCTSGTRTKSEQVETSASGLHIITQHVECFPRQVRPEGTQSRQEAGRCMWEQASQAEGSEVNSPSRDCPGQWMGS